MGAKRRVASDVKALQAMLTTRRMRQLLFNASVLAVPVTLACCGGDHARVFATRARYGAQIDACVADASKCKALCESALYEDMKAQMYDVVEVDSCMIAATEPDGVTLEIDYTGSFECGRRPRGLCEPMLNGRNAGAFLAKVATLEAASVTAFARLVRQLARLGAPGWAIASARSAVADELVHAELASRLAHALGARIEAPAITGDDDASPFELACENAREGMIGETMGALVATCQARAACSMMVRAAFAEIARDEARHAAFAYRLAPYFASLLSRRERCELAEVSHEARQTASRRCDYPLRESDRAWLGIPSSRDLTVATRVLFS